MGWLKVGNIRGPRGQDGSPGKNGRDGKDGRSITGPRGPQGPQGERGVVGPVPKHEWDGTRLRFEMPNGVWGLWVDLKGNQLVYQMGGQGSGGLDLGASASKKLKFHIASLSAFDKVIEVSYADKGLKTERISSVSYASTLYPDYTLTKNIYWLDPGSMNQRIGRIEYIGNVFSPDVLIKNYVYEHSGSRYLRTEINYEMGV